MTIADTTPHESEKRLNPRVSELVSYMRAQQLSGLNYWQLRRLAEKGDIERVELPGPNTALVLASVIGYVEKKRKAQPGVTPSGQKEFTPGTPEGPDA